MCRVTTLTGSLVNTIQSYYTAEAKALRDTTTCTQYCLLKHTTTQGGLQHTRCLKASLSSRVIVSDLAITGTTLTQ